MYVSVYLPIVSHSVVFQNITGLAGRLIAGLGIYVSNATKPDLTAPTEADFSFYKIFTDSTSLSDRVIVPIVLPSEITCGQTLYVAVEVYFALSGTSNSIIGLVPGWAYGSIPFSGEK